MPYAVFARVSSPASGGGSRELARDGGGEAAQPPASKAAHRPLSHASRDSSPASGGAKVKLVGQSCYLNPRPRDAGVEIGSTWYAGSAQGTFVNPAAKLLLIGHAFACGAERVELKTDALNARSRAAMLKMGATFEGIHRRHMRRADGTLRDTAWFSVLREEWPEVKAGLEARLAAYG
jgi:RimJ/RimL family protein N-acetyltransferase